jgi:glucose-6-phosphate 1-epimerase
MTTSPDELATKFEVPGVTFERGPGGLTRVGIATDAAWACLYLHGAHVAAWQPAGQEPVLWMSENSWFAPQKPIRGGVPVCFPWFGPKSDDPDAPGHGTARLVDWTLADVSRDGDDVTLELRLASDEFSHRWWPGDFELSYRVTVGRSLTMSLTVTNTGPAEQTFTEALHSYFAVADVRRVLIGGLDGTRYVDQLSGEAVRQGDEPIRFEAETDRVYTDTAAACTLTDLVVGRRITVEKSGSDSTVVWNPWTAKAARMPDYGDHEWPGMVCIETANAAHNAIKVPAGQSHCLTARISCESM